MTRNQKQNMTRNEDPMRWLSIIPAIPLAEGIAVREAGQVFFSGWRVLRVNEGESDDLICAHRNGTSARTASARTRIDLTDHLSFGYALRWLIQHRRPHEMLFSSTGAATLRFWLGKTTDADRLALAKAMAEVVS